MYINRWYTGTTVPMHIHMYVHTVVVGYNYSITYVCIYTQYIYTYIHR